MIIVIPSYQITFFLRAASIILCCTFAYEKNRFLLKEKDNSTFLHSVTW